MAGLGALLGHLFPIWLRFKGGKGVATALGALLAWAWPVGVACCATWLLVAVVFRFSSLSALISLAAAPVYAWFLMGDLQLVEMSALVAVLVWWSHRANVRRLLAGQEPRIGSKK